MGLTRNGTEGNSPGLEEPGEYESLTHGSESAAEGVILPPTVTWAHFTALQILWLIDTQHSKVVFSTSVG